MLVVVSVVLKSFAHDMDAARDSKIASIVLLSVFYLLRLPGALGLENYSKLEVVDTRGVRYEDVRRRALPPRVAAARCEGRTRDSSLASGVLPAARSYHGSWRHNSHLPRSVCVRWVVCPQRDP